MNKREVLKQIFGYDDFREGQEELVDSLMLRRDVLGVMPTGAGKSLCYQIPALIMDGITLVISPLISLMKDQVNALTQAGVKAAFLNSSLSQGQYETALSGIEKGSYKIIYIAPERLFNTRFERFVTLKGIASVIVDEAHCVSQWGHDFRSSYLDIDKFINGLPIRPVVGAFTATATGKVREDIVKLLKLDNPYILVTGFDRKNLYFETQIPTDKTKELLNLIKERYGKSGIIYCATRSNVESIYELLSNSGISATRYHAGLTQKERHENQNNFLHDYKNVMVATNAFGMGIDKSNVSFVIHYNMPKNIESYYQEAGRAGRDGEVADCILLYTPKDVQINRFLINNNQASNEHLSPKEQEALKQNDLQLLKEMTFYSTGTECLRRYILRYFGENANIFCGNCSNCNKHYDEIDITVDAQKILSCIIRVERLKRLAGKTMIANILHGSENIKIAENGYKELPTYGIMSDISIRRIIYTIEHLIMQGYITLSDDDYPILKTNSMSMVLLNSKISLTMKLPKEKTPAKAKEFIDKSSGTDITLFEKLTDLRRKIAKKISMPAYIIFSDAALHDMCRKLPISDDEFINVLGVGKAKLQKYGEIFMEVIRKHNPSKQPELIDSTEQHTCYEKERAGYAWTEKEDEQLKEEYLSKISIPEISRMHNRTKGAIRSRIKKLETMY